MKLLTLLASGAAVGVGAQVGVGVPLGPMEVKKKHDGVRGAAPQVVGRPRPLDPESQGAREAAALAVGRFNAVANVARRHDLARIVGGTSQVVAGVRYALELELAEVDCPAGTPAETPCPPLADAAPRTIHATVWSRPWLPVESRAQIELSETVNGEVVALPAVKPAEPEAAADGEAAPDAEESDSDGEEDEQLVSGEPGAAVAPGFNQRDEGPPGEEDLARAEEKDSDGEDSDGEESEPESEPESEEEEGEGAEEGESAGEEDGEGRRLR